MLTDSKGAYRGKGMAPIDKMVWYGVEENLVEDGTIDFGADVLKAPVLRGPLGFSVVVSHTARCPTIFLHIPSSPALYYS